MSLNNPPPTQSGLGPTLWGTARLGEMVKMRQARATLHQIGLRFGITGERVRQILRGSTVEGPLPVVPKKWPIQGFKCRMYDHLFASGYVRCCSCGLFVCLLSVTRVRGVRIRSAYCHNCNRQNVRRNRYRSGARPPLPFGSMTLQQSEQARKKAGATCSKNALERARRRFPFACDTVPQSVGSESDQVQGGSFND